MADACHFILYKLIIVELLYGLEIEKKIYTLF